MEIFNGKIDFVLHSIGMSPNVRKGIPYAESSYENMLKTLDISALSFHRILQTAYKLDAISEWGSVIALTYVAAQRTLAGYNDMGDAKALLESIARSFGYIYGKERHVRVNTVSQSPTATTAGSGIAGFDSLVDFSDRMSPLGNADASDCADVCITLFSAMVSGIPFDLNGEHRWISNALPESCYQTDTSSQIQTRPYSPSKVFAEIIKQIPVFSSSFLTIMLRRIHVFN